MIRVLQLTRRLDADPAMVRARLRGVPGRWLPEPADPDGRHWIIFPGTERVGVAVEALVGEPWEEVGGAVWRRLSWEPAARGLWSSARLPAFDGDLGVRTRADGAPELVLRGTYRVPLGALGALADRLGLHRLAHATIATFLRQVAARVTPEPSTAAAPAPAASTSASRAVAARPPHPPHQRIASPGWGRRRGRGCGAPAIHDSGDHR